MRSSARKRRSPRCARCECRAISFRREGEICVRPVLEKSANDGAKRWQIDLVEVDAGAAQSLEQTEKMIRRALDRDCGETFRVRQSLVS